MLALGGIVAACRGCYALAGFYNMAVVKAAREHNRADWKRPAWAADVVREIGADLEFRWFDSGDVYDTRLGRKILEVMRATPDTRHWIPTRMHKFSKFRPILEDMAALHNVVVRFSSDSVSGEVIPGATTSTIIEDTSGARARFLSGGPGRELCRAYDNGGACGPCRHCWSKAVAVVGYVGHGRSMIKVQSEAAPTEYPKRPPADRGAYQDVAVEIR